MTVKITVKLIHITLILSRPLMSPFSGISAMDEERSQIRSLLVGKGIFPMSVNRHEVFQAVLDAYVLDADLHQMEIKVSFKGERGYDTGGLKRELIDCFWDEFALKMDGRSHKVPRVNPSNGHDFLNIGRFISHSYIATGFFPLTLSPLCTKVILCGEDSVTNEELIAGFHGFVDDFESQALHDVRTNPDAMQNVIVPMLSRFQVYAVPTVETLPTLVLNAARFVFVHRSYYALIQIRKGLMAAHPKFWSRCTKPELVNRLYGVLAPTTTLVWGMIEEPSFRTPSQEQVFDHLRRFIHSLSVEMLKKFLRFVTGMSVCSHKPIKIAFNSEEGFKQRPIGHTCGTTLELPVTYEGFEPFCEAFTNILKNSQWWFFDSI